MLPSTLDHILAVQIAVAWAGEARAEPPRLRWWQTDVVDPDGGGDLFRRLTPRTRAWAPLIAVREAARRVDAAARAGLVDPETLRSLFHLDPATDEALADRLAAHRRAGTPPAEALPGLPPLDRFDRAAFGEWLQGLPAASGPPHRVEAGGRRAPGAPASPEALVDRLAAALVPFPDAWPFPHART